MKIQTMSVVVGNSACNAKCPFCVSKTTFKPCPLQHNTKQHNTEQHNTEQYNINWRNFDIACKCAELGGVSTILFTGKGEPTLFPHEITSFLDRLEGKSFPFKELQTNGIEIYNGERYKNSDILLEWWEKGLTTICLSVVHWTDELNAEIYQPTKPVDYKGLIKKLHDYGFSVRLSCMMLDGYIDSFKGVMDMVRFCRANKVEQLTVRPISCPEEDDNDVSKWIRKHTLSDDQLENIRFKIFAGGTKVLSLAHGAHVYDIMGQNLCLTDCLTTNENDENMRQIIFFPDGGIYYDWKYRGARLL